MTIPECLIFSIEGGTLPPLGPMQYYCFLDTMLSPSRITLASPVDSLESMVTIQNASLKFHQKLFSLHFCCSSTSISCLDEITLTYDDILSTAPKAVGFNHKMCCYGCHGHKFLILQVSWYALSAYLVTKWSFESIEKQGNKVLNEVLWNPYIIVTSLNGT